LNYWTQFTVVSATFEATTREWLVAVHLRP
jgi:hypothetical protein